MVTTTGLRGSKERLSKVRPSLGGRLGYSPQSGLLGGGTRLGDSHTGERNSGANHPHHSKQAKHGVDSKHHGGQGIDSNQQAASHKNHSGHVDATMLRLLPAPRKTPEVPLPSPDYYWIETEPYFLTLFYREKFTNIAIREVGGAFDIDFGSRFLLSTPSLRQAQSICHTLAWTLRDSLPIKSSFPEYDVEVKKLPTSK